MVDNYFDKSFLYVIDNIAYHLKYILYYYFFQSLIYLLYLKCYFKLYIYIYIYMCVYIRGAFNKFLDFFCTSIWNCRKLLKIQCIIATHLMRWLSNFYDCRFKWTATAGIGIHPTKAWLSLLVNFKNAIWTSGHFRRTISNKILF